MLNPEQEQGLNDFLDGELSPEEARAFQRDLERDPALQAEERALRKLIEEAGQLPKDVAPAADLWPAIAARLVNVRPRGAGRRSPLKGMLAVAAAVILFLGGIFYGRLVETPERIPAAKQEAAAAPGPDSPGAEFASVRREYDQVRAALHAALERSRGFIDPQTAQVIDQNLTVIANAIHEIEVALQNNPNDQRLIRSLVATYDREVHLLRQAAQLAVLDAAKEEA